MSVLAAYARVRAVAAGVAQPIATVRHTHLAERPLVLVPLTLAGEANAPLAALVGADEADPTLLVVPQPRDRTLRFTFAAELAGVVLEHVERFAPPVPDADPAPGEDASEDLPEDAPQLVVPNLAGVGFVRLFGRSARFRRADGPYPVHPSVPLLGRWLTYFADRAEYPGSSTLLAATEALAGHWATGQSAFEDANLAALLGWIQPPAGMDGRRAALAAEDPLTWPPAGPTTDPGFDNEVLAPAIRAHDQAEPGSPAQRRARAALEYALRGQLEPTWRLVWQALRLLRTLPPGASVAARWNSDVRDFASFHRHLAGGGAPQPRRDGAVAAARRLNRLEHAQARYDAERAFDDPLVMAGYRLTGEAFSGAVIDGDRERRVPNEKGNLVTRPLVTLRTTDPVHLVPGTKVRAAQRRNQTGQVVEIVPDDGGVRVTLELTGGMGRTKVPPPGSVPEPGEVLCYSSVLDENVPSPKLPDAAETPWTHGGPPEPYQPTDDDAQEVWE